MSGPSVQQEQERNRLLRRADWRFLLPDPFPARSVCFADGLLGAAVAAISGATVSPGQAGAAGCDLAVALDPDGATLRRAWAALRPGGACYAECYAPLAGGAHQLRRRLRAAGFTDVACYWPWPAPAGGPASFWVPLDAPGAVGYFIATRPRQRGAVQQLARGLLRACARAPLSLGLAWPICAVARRPGGDGQGPAAPPTQILLTGGRRSVNKAVRLRVPAGAPRPDLVVKLPRVRESIPALRQEAEALRGIHARQPGGLPGVPRVVFHEERGELAALGETVVEGAPLYALLTPATFPGLAHIATDWLARLAGRPVPAPRTDWWPRLVAPVLADFEDCFGVVTRPEQIRAAREQLVALPDLALVPEQRDFSPWNVLIAPGGELAVLDWEGAELGGLPALDLIYFLTYLAFFVEGAMESGRLREAYRAARDPATFTGEVVQGCLRRYCAQVGLDPALLQPLRLLCWMLHARAEYELISADVGGPPGREALRRSLFLALWEEDIRAQPERVGAREPGGAYDHE